jgi:hypothetical protein
VEATLLLFAESGSNAWNTRCVRRGLSVGLAVCAVAIGIAGCGGNQQGHKETISAGSLRPWPFTVSTGTLRCVPGNARPPLGDVLFKPGNKNYGVNGAALHDGYPRPTPIRKRLPNAGPGHYVHLGHVIYEGTTLCPKLGP